MVYSNETFGPLVIFLVWSGRASEEWSETERIFSLKASMVTLFPDEPHRDVLGA